MPLTRANMTAASQRMLPTYPAFFGVVGLGLLLTPIARLQQTPVFNFVDGYVGIRYWGLGFLTLAAWFIVALAVHRRRWYQIALGVGIFWMGLWAVVTLASSLGDLSSFTAWAWPAFIARAQWASLVSLETRET